MTQTDEAPGFRKNQEPLATPPLASPSFDLTEVQMLPHQLKRSLFWFKESSCLAQKLCLRRKPNCTGFLWKMLRTMRFLPSMRSSALPPGIQEPKESWAGLSRKRSD